MLRRLVSACLLVLATGCGEDGDVGSAPPPAAPTSAASTSRAPTSTPPSTGPELDEETARNRNLASIGPDLANVAAAEGVSGAPIVPIGLAATDSDSPCSTPRFAAEGLPDGLGVTQHGDCTARVSGTIRAPVGRYVVTYRVSDDTGASDVSIAVVEVRA